MGPLRLPSAALPPIPSRVIGEADCLLLLAGDSKTERRVNCPAIYFP